MRPWLRRLRGALGTGVTWAAGWAVAGVLIGAMSLVLPGLLWDTLFGFFDAPLPALAIPGFVGGTIFSAILGVAGRNRRFDQLSLPWVTACGAAGGLLLAALPVAIVGAGVGSFAIPGLWLFSGLVVGLSAASAAGTLLLAQKAEDHTFSLVDNELLTGSSEPGSL